ncbi:Hypothetical predicted protein [Mytilus galloprovincialis]|uniref:Uncharacterized protein n=1 Tax=Mytilus galloprovincialis TaxID=29158 RepID=A0A8B6FB27_MYTGA|nr:Hypothetical predicted protein [Mytilus galloprovincialis]
MVVTAEKERQKALSDLGCYGLLFAICFIILTICGIILANFLSKDPDWDISAWYQIFYGTFTIALCSLALAIITFCCIDKHEKKGQRDEVKKWVNHFVIVLWISFVAIFPSCAFLGGFIAESNVFSCSRNVTIPEDEVRLSLCSNVYKSSTIACTVCFVIFFYSIAQSCAQRSADKGKLLQTSINRSNKFKPQKRTPENPKIKLAPIPRPPKLTRRYSAEALRIRKPDERLTDNKNKGKMRIQKPDEQMTGHKNTGRMAKLKAIPTQLKFINLAKIRNNQISDQHETVSTIQSSKSSTIDGRPVRTSTWSFLRQNYKLARDLNQPYTLDEADDNYDLKNLYSTYGDVHDTGPPLALMSAEQSQALENHANGSGQPPFYRYKSVAEIPDGTPPSYEEACYPRY